MSLFDDLVNQALSQNAELTHLRVVVEKELLHHDILLAMSDAGLLFIKYIVLYRRNLLTRLLWF